jgi:hypothetical protein
MRIIHAAAGAAVMQHYCEFGPTNTLLGIEPCGAPASVKIGGRWFCEDHADSVAAHAGLMDALREVQREEEEF